MKIKLSYILAFALLMFATSAFSQVQWQFINKTFATGDTVAVDFYATGYTDIESFQYTLKFDTATLRLRGTTNAQRFETTGVIAGFGPGCFSSAGPGYALKAWEIRCVFSGIYGQTVAPGVKIFTIFLVAKKAGSVCNTLQLWKAAPVWPNAWKAPFSQYVPLTMVCAETPAMQQQKSVSLERGQDAVAVSVFPNPTTDKIVLSIKLEEDFEASYACYLGLDKGVEIQMRLYDSSSRLVWVNFGVVAYGGADFEYVMPEEAGLYFLEVRDETDAFFVKIIEKQ
jgi:hypothetical protein